MFVGLIAQNDLIAGRIACGYKTWENSLDDEGGFSAVDYGCDQIPDERKEAQAEKPCENLIDHGLTGVGTAEGGYGQTDDGKTSGDCTATRRPEDQVVNKTIIPMQQVTVDGAG